MASTKKKTGNGQIETLNGVTNDAAPHIETSEPYVATVIVEGTSALLFHRWSCDDVEEKSKAAKGSTAKKNDNVDSYVYRCDDGSIGIPGEYLRMSIVHAARFRQDPRSPRKSAMDLFKAGIVPLTECASLGTKQWDYLDKRRVTVQRAGITRMRPGFKPGWRASFDLQVLVPEYIAPMVLLDVISQAGKLVGIADFRPTFGRFQVVSFDVGLT